MNEFSSIWELDKVQCSRVKDRVYSARDYVTNIVFRLHVKGIIFKGIYRSSYWRWRWHWRRYFAASFWFINLTISKSRFNVMIFIFHVTTSTKLLIKSVKVASRKAGLHYKSSAVPFEAIIRQLQYEIIKNIHLYEESLFRGFVSA